MTEEAINELETEHPTWYDGEATTAGTVEKMLTNLKNGAQFSTVLERCANG